MSEPYHWSVRRRGPFNHVRLLLLAVLAIMVPVPAFVSIFPAPPRAPRLHAGGGGNSVNREELRKSLVAEGLDDILAARAVEAADKAVSIWEMQVIDFCRPPEVATMTRVLGRVADLSITCDGGFPQAERQRVFFSRALDYAVDEEDARKERGGYLAAISVEGNFIFDRATHRDFLGALLGTGIAREKVSSGRGSEKRAGEEICRTDDWIGRACDGVGGACQVTQRIRHGARYIKHRPLVS